MAWKDFIEVQIDCVPMQVVDWGQKRMPVKMPWLNSILLAAYSFSLLTAGTIIWYQKKAGDKTSLFSPKSGQRELRDALQAEFALCRKAKNTFSHSNFCLVLSCLYWQASWLTDCLISFYEMHAGISERMYEFCAAYIKVRMSPASSCVSLWSDLIKINISIYRRCFWNSATLLLMKFEEASQFSLPKRRVSPAKIACHVLLLIRATSPNKNPET